MGTKRILIVDDSEVILDIVEMTLHEHGYDTARAKSGEKALEIVTDYNPHAIILDWMMDGMDGNEVLEHLQAEEQTRHIPVMMLTGKSEVLDISEILKLGAKDYIVKPFDKDNLILRLQKLIDKYHRKPVQQ